MTSDRIAELTHIEPAQVIPMTGGASAKLFFRLLENNPHVAIVFETNDALEEFLEIHACLSVSGVPVPRLERTFPDHRLAIVEDLGDDTLTKRMSLNLSDAFEIYERLIDIMARIQETGGPSIAHKRAFDAEKYEFEYSFHFLDKLIGTYYRYPLSPDERAVLDEFHTQLISRLLQPPHVLVHRDFQSSNILFRGDDPVLIDFQDARLGNPWYDIVALLEDVYVNVPDPWKKKMISRLASLTGAVFSQEMYDSTVIQRKLHDAGAFAYCFQKLGNPFYLKYIETAFSHAVETMRRYPSWTPASRILDRILQNGRSS